MYAREIFDTVEGVEFDDLLKVISMVCGLMKGLPEEIIMVIRHLDGLAFDDVRPEYGIAARGLLVRALTTEYTKIANRRVKRIDEFGQE